MDRVPREVRKLKPLWRVAVEVGSILFLFYANLLMGEFTRNNGRGKSLAAGLVDVFTIANFAIGLLSAVMGYLLFEYLRRRV